MDLRKIWENEPYNKFVEVLASLAASSDLSSVDILREALKYKDSFIYTKFVTPRLICMALIQKGPIGIEALLASMSSAWGAVGPRAIIESLWFASEGRISDDVQLDGIELVPPLNEKLSSETVEKAVKAFDEIVARASTDAELFGKLIDFFYFQNAGSRWGSSEEQERFRTRVFNSFAKGRIRITESLLQEFESLVARDESEEVYQKFLADHPVFLDPLASEVIPKQRLGSQYITDFVVRRLDNKYLLVEIEKPQDAVFTVGNDFSAKFSHALGQILDFQQWVDAHAEYGRSLLPNISSPKGILIMGNAASFSPWQRQKLHRFNVNSSSVLVLTFDEVLQNGRRLYDNIYHS
jgi:hypothetical protein